MDYDPDSWDDNSRIIGRNDHMNWRETPDWVFPIIVFIMVIGGLFAIGLIKADEAAAHETPPWKCQYLEAPAGITQYQWEQKHCIPWRTTHTYYETHGWLWPCRIQPVGTSRSECMIRKVFGSEGGTPLANRAVGIARCENTHLLPWVTGPNDEYGNPREGLWQFGTRERAVFGYGDTALEQTQGALRYYRVSGWNPWECA